MFGDSRKASPTPSQEAEKSSASKVEGARPNTRGSDQSQARQKHEENPEVGDSKGSHCISLKSSLTDANSKANDSAAEIRYQPNRTANHVTASSLQLSNEKEQLEMSDHHLRSLSKTIVKTATERVKQTVKDTPSLLISRSQATAEKLARDPANTTLDKNQDSFKNQSKISTNSSKAAVTDSVRYNRQASQDLHCPINKYEAILGISVEDILRRSSTINAFNKLEYQSYMKTRKALSEQTQSEHRVQENHHLPQIHRESREIKPSSRKSILNRTENQTLPHTDSEITIIYESELMKAASKEWERSQSRPRLDDVKPNLDTGEAKTGEFHAPVLDGCADITERENPDGASEIYEQQNSSCLLNKDAVLANHLTENPKENYSPRNYQPVDSLLLTSTDKDILNKADDSTENNLELHLRTKQRKVKSKRLPHKRAQQSKQQQSGVIQKMFQTLRQFSSKVNLSKEDIKSKSLDADKNVVIDTDHELENGSLTSEQVRKGPSLEEILSGVQESKSGKPSDECTLPVHLPGEKPSPSVNTPDQPESSSSSSNSRVFKPPHLLYTRNDMAKSIQQIFSPGN